MTQPNQPPDDQPGKAVLGHGEFKPASVAEVPPIGTRIRFTKEIDSPPSDDHPFILYARKGTLGTILGHDAEEGYFVTWDGWPNGFGASRDEFEPISDQPMTQPSQPSVEQPAEFSIEDHIRLLKREINESMELQSLLYDLDLLPEQLEQGSREWTQMVILADWYRNGMPNKSNQPQDLEAVLRERRDRFDKWWESEGHKHAEERGMDPERTAFWTWFTWNAALDQKEGK